MNALLLAALLASATPAPEPSVAVTASPVLALARSIPALMLMDETHDSSITPGLRHMAVGAAVGAVGVLALALGGAVFAGAFGVALVTMIFLPSLFTVATAAMTGATAVVVVSTVVGFLLLVGGGLWTGVNGLLVLARLMPGYKPGPATDYLAP